ncbi:MAG: serine/threonine protein kinase [Xenococcaceae cyanobacterium]
MLEAGQVIGDRYQLKQKLGPNAGRQTWLAKDLETEPNQLVAVKLLAFGGNVQWDDLKLFEREAQILKQLNHPRIPKYRDYFSIDERTLWFGLVQEYIPGVSLKELLNQGKRFTELEVRQIAKEVLQILTYLHRLYPPVLHRDIKPSNLILGEEQRVYLVDFGAVQDSAASEGATFTVVGTYGYAPMEQFGGRAIPASDLYALGATLIHLLTGIAPADLPTRDLRIQFRDRLTLNSELVNWLERITEPALERRLQTASQALEALEFGLQRTNSSRNNPHHLISSSPSATAFLERPPQSKIQVQKSPSSLEITIPMRGIQGLGDFGVAIVLFVSAGLFLLVLPEATSILPFGLFPLFLLGWLCLKASNHLFGHTKVNFNRNNFEIQKLFFNFHYNRKPGLTNYIKDISIKHKASDWNSGQMVATEVIITSNSLLSSNKFERRLFGQGLSELELMWLAQEIRDWLASKY